MGMVVASQLDADRLDTEVETMLLSCLRRCFQWMEPSIMEVIQPELEFVLRSAMFSLTIAVDVATPGQQLTNLRYRNERAIRSSLSSLTTPWLSSWQKVGLWSFTIAMPYLDRKSVV